MRTYVLLFGILFLVGTVAGGQSEESDHYSLRVVQAILRLRSGGQKFIFSQNQKSLARLGDGVSIAILKLLDEQDLKNPQVIRDFLPIIQQGFSQPELISLEADRKPSVTLFLLNFLRHNVVDPQTQRDIQQTVEVVERVAQR